MEGQGCGVGSVSRECLSCSSFASKRRDKCQFRVQEQELHDTCNKAARSTFAGSFQHANDSGARQCAEDGGSQQYHPGMGIKHIALLVAQVLVVSKAQEVSQHFKQAMQRHLTFTTARCAVSLFACRRQKPVESCMGLKAPSSTLSSKGEKHECRHKSPAHDQSVGVMICDLGHTNASYSPAGSPSDPVLATLTRKAALLKRIAPSIGITGPASEPPRAGPGSQMSYPGMEAGWNPKDMGI